MKTTFFSKVIAFYIRRFRTTGTTRKGLTYVFDPDVGQLSISGRGERTSSRGVFSALGIELLDDDYSLTHVNFEKAKRIKRIGSYSFCRCMGLNSIDIPASVESISENAFYECKNVTQLHFHSLVPPTIEPDPFFYIDINFCFIPKGTLPIYLKAKGWSSHVHSWVFIDQVVGIDIRISVPGTLRVSLVKLNRSHPTQITHLTLSGTINDDDFEFIRTGLTSLYSLDLTHLENATLPHGALAKTRLAEIKLPSCLTSIGEQAFSGCRGLIGNVLFPETLTHIGDYAFKNCVGIRGVLHLPHSLTSIGAYAFAGCTGLSGVLSLPIALNRLGEYAFSGCRGLLGEIAIPHPITTIEKGVFSGCLAVSSLSMANVLTIGSEAFAGCRALHKITCTESPPQLTGESVFDGVPVEHCTIYIPYTPSSLNAYFAAPQWALFRNYRECINP